MIDTLNKLLDPMRRRVRLMISRAVLSAISDGKGIQLVQVKLLEGEVRDGVERFQNYAFSSVPLIGAEGIMACVSGNRDHGVILAMDDRRYRVRDLQPGEAVMYTHKDKEAHKHRIIFKNDGSIEVVAKNITVKATETARIEGDNVVIHASSMFRFDVNGHGQKWLPTKVDTWQIGEVPGTAHIISPPEIP
ncbi:MAG: phage baseplate assembly protein V [Methylotenera sp.]|nr:phage baseplate assembly protein V [Methylotenera sp.]